MSPSPARPPGRAVVGFSLIELVAAVAIAMILGVLIVPNYKEWFAAAAQARCMANMRSIHIALSGYLNDHNQVWPQGPSPQEGAPWAKFWIDTLKPHGIEASVWQCPSIDRMLGSPRSEQITDNSVHYVPTLFDDQPGTARKWPTQPWLIERADAHGHGALICFTDGSVKPFNKVLAEQGLR